MADPITLKLRQKDDRTEIEIQVLHPMDPGDALPQKSGSRRSPSFLQSMVIQLNGKTLVEGQLSASLSKNPKFGFSFSNINAGDKFAVYFTDNKGMEIKSEIAAGG
jgi:thiosulfate oxidation carrier complex protein SoxZ